MRKLAKWLGLFVGAGLLLLILGTLAPRPLFAVTESGAKTFEILMISNPIHTDIAIPATKDVLQVFGFLGESGLPTDSPQLKWLVFGWGGRAFYLETPTWSELKLVPVLKALTIDRSAMHAELAGELDRALPNIKSIKMSAGQFKKVVADLAASFAEAEPKAIENAGYGQYDRFYEAKGGFNILFGCNTWASAILRDAGLQTGVWNPLPQSLCVSIELHN